MSNVAGSLKFKTLFLSHSSTLSVLMDKVLTEAIAGLEADSLFSCSVTLFPVPKPEMLVQQHLLSPFSRLHVSRGRQTTKHI